MTEVLDWNALQSWLERESRQGRVDLAHLHARPVRERVEELLCIADAKVLHAEGDGLLLEAPENFARFREGDRVLVGLAREGHPARAGYEMEWIDFDPATRRIELARSPANRQRPPSFSAGDRVHVDSASDDLAVFLGRKLRELSRSTFAEASLAFLNGTLEQKAAPVQEEIFSEVTRALELIPGQIEALRRMLGHFPVSGIQGPAGTGKTSVLAAAALYYHLQGRRVVLSAMSHFAINHALNRVVAAGERLGRTVATAKISRNKNTGLDRRIQRLARISALGESLPSTVIGITLYKLMADAKWRDFDVLLFDEASQAPLVPAVLAMAYAKKTHFFGDHAQLGPIVHPRHTGLAASSSALAWLSKGFSERLEFLESTFRLGEDLVEWPSRAFYGGRLRSLRPASPPDSSPDPLADHPILRSSVTRAFVPLRQGSFGKNNPVEAALVARWLRLLVFEGGVAPERIAVLVPYRSQQNLIRRLAHRAFPEGATRILRSLVVDTVDRMQGQEREIVILSLTASDPDHLGRTADHFLDPGRLNVALTRASRKRITVGHPDLALARLERVEQIPALDRLLDFMDREPNVDVPHEDLLAAQELLRDEESHTTIP